MLNVPKNLTDFGWPFSFRTESSYKPQRTADIVGYRAQDSAARPR